MYHFTASNIVTNTRRSGRFHSLVLHVWAHCAPESRWLLCAIQFLILCFVRFVTLMVLSWLSLAHARKFIVHTGFGAAWKQRRMVRSAYYGHKCALATQNNLADDNAHVHSGRIFNSLYMRMKEEARRLTYFILKLSNSREFIKMSSWKIDKDRATYTAKGRLRVEEGARAGATLKGTKKARGRER